MDKDGNVQDVSVVSSIHSVVHVVFMFMQIFTGIIYGYERFVWQVERKTLTKESLTVGKKLRQVQNVPT